MKSVTTPREKKRISFRGLLAIYAIVPLLLSVVAIDYFIFNSALKPYVTVGLTGTLLYIVLFELPHIFASYVTFIDREYLVQYRRRILYQLPLVLGLSFIVATVSFTLTAVLIITYTLYHVLSQQAGITLLMIGKKHWLHDYWRYLSISIAVLIQLYLIKFPLLLPVPQIYFGITFWIAVAIFAVVSATIYITTAPGIGRQYFLATTLMLFSAVFFFLAGYVFFSIFVLRFVHDVTAFYFYIVHDANRNAEAYHNALHALLAPLKIPFIVLVPILGILFAYLVRFETTFYSGLIYGSILISFTHYYLESFMWRRDSPHRAQIAFAP